MPIRRENPAKVARLGLAAALASASLLWGSNVTKGPDAGNYTATDSAVYSFIDLTAGGGSASVLSGIDDGVSLLTLPFAFQFYGTSYTLACVSANGIVSFVTSPSACTATSDFVNTDLSSTAPPGDRPSIVPYWTDLTFQVSGAGAVYYQTQGAPGSQQFILQWSNAYLQNSPNQVTFEVVLSEGSNQILFQYQTADFGQGTAGTDGSLATVGIRDAGGQSNGREIAWSYNAPVLGNSTAILFSTAGAGQVSNTITSNPVGLSVSIDGVTYPTPKVVNWAPGSSHTLSLTTPQTNGGVGTQYAFSSWSTGDTAPQIGISAPGSGTTYTANFALLYQLTTGVNPANGGTITGAGWYNAGSPASVQASAATGYTFAYFSGDLNGSGNPQMLTMNGAKNVVANFGSTAAPALHAAISGKVNGTLTGQRLWSIRLSNSGLGTAVGAQITGFTISQSSGTACSPAVSLISPLPVTVGDIAPSAYATGQVTLNFAGCPDTTGRFTAIITYSANSGAYSGSTTIYNQTK